MRFVVVAAVIAAALCSAALAGPAGTLDPSFGVGGRVVSDRIVTFDHLVEAPGGDVVASGRALDVNRSVLARYHSDGSIAASFGTGGFAEDDSIFTFLDLAIQADGKILAVALGTVTGTTDVRRYDSSGALDPTFDGDGILPATLASRLAVQPDGKIIVARQQKTPDNLDWDVRLDRYDASGSPDGSFGLAGSVVTDVGTRPSVQGMLLQPDGRILVTGTLAPFPTGKGYLLRYQSGGTLDPSFATGGKLLDTTLTRVGENVALQPDGKILTAKIDLARWDGTGNLDTTFGSSGSIVGTGKPSGIAVQPDGRIVVSSNAPSAPPLRRFTSSGNLDAGFGDAGIGQHVADLHALTALLLQADGRIVTAIAAERYFPLERFFGGTCGDTVTEAGEECDDGNATPGDGCEPGCCLADADGDGLCDAQDPCTGAAPTGAVVVFASLGSLDRQRFKVKGAVDFPSAPAFDPLANGVRIVLREPGRYLYDFTLPGGAFASSPGYGWTATGSPAHVWRFRGSVLPKPTTDTPNFADVVSLKIVRAMNTPGRVKFALKTIQVHDNPVSSLTAMLVLDPPTATSGSCAEVTLPCVPAGPAVRCRL
jgi:uncharacterized delta-60 repeat protein